MHLFELLTDHTKKMVAKRLYTISIDLSQHELTFTVEAVDSNDMPFTISVKDGNMIGRPPVPAIAVSHQF